MKVLLHEDFLFDNPVAAIVMHSRVRQSRRLGERVEIWRLAIHELVSTPRLGRRVESMDDGRLVPWEEAS